MSELLRRHNLQTTTCNDFDLGIWVLSIITLLQPGEHTCQPISKSYNAWAETDFEQLHEVTLTLTHRVLYVTHRRYLVNIPERLILKVSHACMDSVRIRVMNNYKWWPWPGNSESCTRHIVPTWLTYLPTYFKILPCTSEFLRGQ